MKISSLIKLVGVLVSLSTLANGAPYALSRRYARPMEESDEALYAPGPARAGQGSGDASGGDGGGPKRHRQSPPSGEPTPQRPRADDDGESPICIDNDEGSSGPVELPKDPTLANACEETCKCQTNGRLKGCLSRPEDQSLRGDAQYNLQARDDDVVNRLCEGRKDKNQPKNPRPVKCICSVPAEESESDGEGNKDGKARAAASGEGSSKHAAEVPVLCGGLFNLDPRIKEAVKICQDGCKCRFNGMNHLPRMADQPAYKFGECPYEPLVEIYPELSIQDRIKKIHGDVLRDRAKRGVATRFCRSWMEPPHHGVFCGCDSGYSPFPTLELLPVDPKEWEYGESIPFYNFAGGVIKEQYDSTVENPYEKLKLRHLLPTRTRDGRNPWDRAVEYQALCRSGSADNAGKIALECVKSCGCALVGKQGGAAKLGCKFKKSVAKDLGLEAGSVSWEKYNRVHTNFCQNNLQGHENKVICGCGSDPGPVGQPGKPEPEIMEWPADPGPAGPHGNVDPTILKWQTSTSSQQS